MAIEKMLAELAQGWSVTIANEDNGWRLALEDRAGTRFVYRGDLKKVVQAAWAGEPSGMVA